MNGYDMSAQPEESEIPQIHEKHLAEDLERKKQFRRYRDELFAKAVKIVEYMFIISFPALIIAPYTIKSPANIILPIVAVLIPTLLLLVLVRFAYSKERVEKTPPSILFNLTREVMDTLKEIFKK